MTKLKVNYDYILSVCESIAKSYDQEVSNVSFKDEMIHIVFKNKIELIMDQEEIKTIIQDTIMSELHLDSLKLGKFQNDIDNKVFIESITFE